MALWPLGCSWGSGSVPHPPCCSSPCSHPLEGRHSSPDSLCCSPVFREDSVPLWKGAASVQAPALGGSSRPSQRPTQGHADRCCGQVPAVDRRVHPDQCLCHQPGPSWALPAPACHLPEMGTWSFCDGKVVVRSVTFQRPDLLTRIVIEPRFARIPTPFSGVCAAWGLWVQWAGYWREDSDAREAAAPASGLPQPQVSALQHLRAWGQAAGVQNPAVITLSVPQFPHLCGGCNDSTYSFIMTTTHRNSQGRGWCGGNSVQSASRL